MNYKKILKGIEKNLLNSKVYKIGNFLGISLKNSDDLENNLKGIETLLNSKKMYNNYKKDFDYINKSLLLKNKIVNNIVNQYEKSKKISFDRNNSLRVFINEILNSGLTLEDFVNLFEDFYKSSDKFSDLKIANEMLANNEIYNFVIEKIANGKIKKVSVKNEDLTDNRITGIFKVLKKEFKNLQFVGVLKNDSKEFRLSKKLFDKIKTYENDSIKANLILSWNVVKELEIID
jgi:hypothetical protein